MKTGHIVFHTHWDREWYLPFETFRHRFMQVMDRILDGIDSKEIDTFVLDGQVAALEDYLIENDDELNNKVIDYIEKGRLVIGPWYVLADEFLVTGEALIRNLEIGMKKAEQLGGVQKVGYLPDTFGHIGQMPQLLNQFQINNSFLWRGVLPEKSEFVWKAPDGSSVLAIFLPDGYYQPLLNEINPEKAVQSFIEKVQPWTDSDQLLLPNGGDHLMPSLQGMKEVIDSIQSVGSVHWKQSTLEDYLRDVRKSLVGTDALPEHQGEMRSNNHFYILPNVLSTRTYLKEQNQRMEDKLTGHVEPLIAYASFMNNHCFRKTYLENSWKLLLENHPHDSICGCSVDNVHREMETRTMKLEQRLDVSITEAQEILGMRTGLVSGQASRSPFDDDLYFSVFNPHPWNYTGFIKGELWLNEEEEFAKGFYLNNSKGERISPIVIKSERGEFFASPRDAAPDFKTMTKYTFGFHCADLKGLSMTPFEVKYGEHDQLKQKDRWKMENASLSIELEKEGTLTMLDKKSGNKISGLMNIYSSMDAGDEYNYSPPTNDPVTFAELAEDPVVFEGEGYSTMKYRLLLNLPKQLNNDRTGPSNETIQSVVTISLQLTEATHMNVNIHISNHASDQRLRAIFPIGTSILESKSDSSFEWVTRPAKKEELVDARKGTEVPVVVEPSHSAIIGYNDQRSQGIALGQRGLQEYQVIEKEQEDEIHLTLLRSVGWLSRDDLRTRGGGAGPRLETPEAQCIGDYSFDLIVAPFNETKSESQWLRTVKEFRVPPLVLSGHAESQEGKGLLTIDDPDLQWSAVRPVDQGIECRLWNPTNKEIVFFAESTARNVEKWSLNGEKLKEIDIRNGVWEDTVASHEIVTYLLKRQHPDL
ncbi:glycoside hydrolase family 38 [Salipaludibacillus keqinensis]|uniref:Glycoside hydrolase family 38 n=1 Tax=Salipaludibacillus keqinensis TaxID=2045207 RepID=A0A323TDL4_9BACI|nr:glycoside hydrolase family 38 C-terminal domain-containing protein [Salipaludibacillus keqinensis]PYZ92746.1 glycoside hydrolase family 38 [Salipaludibacillus keqinensis]